VQANWGIDCFPRKDLWRLEANHSRLGFLGNVLDHVYGNPIHHQGRTFPSGRNGCIRVHTLRPTRQRHPYSRLLRARRQYPLSHCLSPSARIFAVASCSVGIIFYVNTVVLWPTVIIHRNGFSGYISKM
jgi:hypothetical protein